MRFIGQHHIMNHLKILLPYLYENQNAGKNFLLVGPSGYGKTTMALSIASYITVNFDYFLAKQIPEDFPRKHVSIIDEIHALTTPEILYPIMDTKKFVLILVTNENGNLAEPLVNRCLNFVFDDYDTDALMLIAREDAPFSAPDESFLKIIEAGNRNPRKIKNLVDNLGLYFNHYGVDSNTADMDKILTNVFRIENGLDTLCRRYIQVLAGIGGKASLVTLRNILHVSEDTIKNQVEPVLLQKGLIQITQKGRILV